MPAGPGEAGEDEARADATTDMTLGSGVAGDVKGLGEPALALTTCGRCSVCCAFKTTAPSNGKFPARGLPSTSVKSTTITRTDGARRAGRGWRGRSQSRCHD